MKVNFVLPAWLRTESNVNIFLERSLPSFFNQSYENIVRTILINGCCVDIRLILEHLAKKYNFRDIYYTPNNIGVSRAINTCIRINYSSCDAISILAADDSCDSRMIEKQVEVFNLKQDAQVVGVGLNNISGNGHVDKYEHVYNGSLEDFKKEIINRNLVCCGGALIKKEVFDRVGFFQERKVGVIWPEYNKIMYEDWDFWVRCARNNIRIINLDEGLYNWYHDASTPK